MKLFREILKYRSCCKNILRQIKTSGDNLEFEQWIHSGTIHVNDEFTCITPDIHFDVMKYYVWWAESEYRFVLHNESAIMRYPEHPKLFNILFAPTIFKACAKKYKQQEKQK